MTIDTPLTVQEALLDTLAAWRDRIPYLQSVRLAEAVSAICIDQHRADMARIRADDARAMLRPGWPIERAAIFANAEGRN